MLEAAFFVVIGLVLLSGGAEFLVRGASHIALRFGIPTLVVGLTIVAFGTSAPELVTSIQAALLGKTDMAVGNNIGSNIANILLVLGAAAVVRPFDIDPQLTKKDAPIMLFVSTLLIAFLWDGSLVRWEGSVLFAGIVAYVLQTGWSTRKEMRSEHEDANEFELDLDVAKSEPIWRPVFFLLGGLAGLIIGSDLFVRGASDLAAIFGVSEAVIGLTVMAIGTSLPEVFTVVVATLKGSSGLVTGNAVGSNIFNIMCVLGAVSMIVPLSLGNVSTFDLWVFWGVAFLTCVRLFVPIKITRIEGVVYLLAYLAYILFNYGFL